MLLTSCLCVDLLGMWNTALCRVEDNPKHKSQKRPLIVRVRVIQNLHTPFISKINFPQKQLNSTILILTTTTTTSRSPHHQKNRRGPKPIISKCWTTSLEKNVWSWIKNFRIKPAWNWIAFKQGSRIAMIELLNHQE